MAELKYLCIWTDDTNKPYIKPHSHNFYELVYFKSGRVLTNVGQKSYETTAGTFTLIEKQVKHDELRYEESRTICLVFDSDEIIKSQFYTDTSGEILSILMTMLKEYNTRLYNYEELMDLRVKEIYLLIKRLEKGEEAYSKNFQYAVNYINENYRDKIVFSELSKSLNLSYDYFQHRFKELTGFSPQNFLIRRRLEEAEKMLKRKDLNCTEIAYNCGFSNSAQFSMLFKKLYQVTPREYRKRF